MSVKSFFTDLQQNAILDAIEKAEKNTSGEIRVHLEAKCKIDPTKRAIEVFEKLQMHQTELRNGILFYLASDDKKFAVIGDTGINNVVPKNFWDSIKDGIISNFKNGKFAEGLIEGIYLTGEKLVAHFPHQENDVNELSNDISFGE
jgi:uncharacterized membrane protein